MISLPYMNNCVSWPRRYVRDLSDLCDSARDIKRQTFIRRVDRNDLRSLEYHLGYGPGGLQMADDWHVQYRTGRLFGHRVYFLIWSGIEYVFGPAPVPARIKRGSA